MPNDPSDSSAGPSSFGALKAVLVLDPDDDHRRAIQLLLSELGVQCSAAATTKPISGGLADESSYDAVICAAALSGDVVEHVQADQGPVLIVSASSDEVDDITTRPAFDLLLRPHDRVQLELALHRVERYQQLRQNHSPAATKPADPVQEHIVAGMIGVSAAIKDVFRTIEKIASHKATVLVSGESGTGKELVARAIHNLGVRSSRPFVAVNCGAIPPTLLESELFGHAKGAFTDANRDKKGLFEEAHTGTLFLDEIGELQPSLQVKLLRALQEGEIRRIGDNEPISIDVRVLAATLRDLHEDVQAGRFREDLYYRLNVLPLALPPLRERRECIPALVAHFVDRYSAKHSGVTTSATSVSDEAMALLQRAPWPGNIRELENAIERAMVLCEGPVIEAHLLEEKINAATDPISAVLSGGELSIKKTTRIIEEELIRRALVETGGNRTSAAKLLEISHRALLYKIKEYGL